MSLFRAVATVGGFTLLSRITGFARDILIASFLGAGTVADAFFVAFKFPNLFRRLFAEGAVAAAFVPLYSQTLEKEGAAEAHLFARRAFHGSGARPSGICHPHGTGDALGDLRLCSRLRHGARQIAPRRGSDAHHLSLLIADLALRVAVGRAE